MEVDARSPVSLFLVPKARHRKPPEQTWEVSMELSPMVVKYIIRFMYVVLLYISGDRSRAKAAAIDLSKTIRNIFREHFE